ncbi:MAG: FtsH protease activity modulator HflK [bacterium]
MAEEDLFRKRNALIIVMMINVALIILIFSLAAVSGSMALIAAGWMSVENLFLTFGVFLGVVMSGKKEGFSKRIALMENLLALLISTFIFYIAIRMFVKVLSGPSAMISHIPATVAGVFAGASMCYFMARYKIYIGKSCSSPSIEAAGYHCRTHVFMWLAVAVGLIGYMVGLTTLNRLAVVLVLTIVISTGWMIFSRSYKSLTSGLPTEHICHLERSYKQIVGLGAVVLLLYFASGFYIVSWDQQGVIRRFGAWVGKKGAAQALLYHRVRPGLGYHLPWPIESIEKVKVDEVKRLETEILLLLTGDENLVRVNVGTHYQIKDAASYIFNITQIKELIKYNLETAIRKIVGLKGVDYLLTVGKIEIEGEVKQWLQSLLDRDRSGVQVLSVQVLLLDPPEEVADAFRDVASAKEDMVAYINEAEAYRNQVVPEAIGKATAMIRRAEGYRIEKVNNARGESKRYLHQLKEYSKAREITDLRLYIETMERILPGVEKVVVAPEIEQETTDLWLFDKNLKGKIVGLE